MGRLKMFSYCSLSREASGHRSNKFFFYKKLPGSSVVELILLCRWERERWAEE